MKKYIWVCCLFVFGLIASCNLVAQVNDSRDQKVQMLFVLHSAGGKIEKSSDPTSQGILTLYGMGKNVDYFSDRPTRIAGRIGLQDFLDKWNQGSDSFHENPPNASLVVPDKGKKFFEISVELSDPSYDERGNILKFYIKTLGKETISDREFGDAALFCDALPQYADLLVKK